MKNPIKAIWKYRVKPEFEQEFLELYNHEGTWVRLFRGAHGYIRTDLLKDLESPHTYVTIDIWESHEAYQSFYASNKEEIDRIDQKGDQTTVEEVRLGVFR